MKNKVEHWAIVKPEHLEEPALVIIDKTNPGTIYWNGGPSHMTHAKYQILEDAYVDSATENGSNVLDILELHMYQNNFKRYEPANQPLRSEGWLSPDGKVYFCYYGEHRSSARIITAKYYGKIVDNAENFLENKLWLKIYADGLMVRGDWKQECTQKQIDAMGWLCGAENATPKWLERIKENIEYFEVIE